MTLSYEQETKHQTMLTRLFSGRRKNRYGWFGDYTSWQKVLEQAGGYDSNVILERTTHSLLKVKDGEAAYERDSVVFDAKVYPYPLMAYLTLSRQLKRQPLNILDFGGSLGSTYYQIKEILTPDLCASYNVVEQPHYVARGKENFSDSILSFYDSIEDCLAEKAIDFVLLSSSVQYLEKPHSFLQKLAAFNFDFILFDRIAFNRQRFDRLTLQIVPPEIYPASYPAWFFHEEFFLSHFDPCYRVAASFPSYVAGEADMLIDNKLKGCNKGFYLINRTIHA
jgi:putative methyltransferase (TIGR04325 family)